MTIFRRPTAGAVHIAGGGGVHQDQPRYIDVVFLRGFLRHMIAPDAALIDGVGEKGFENVGVVVADQALDIMGPFPLGIVRKHVQRLEGGFAPNIAVQLLHHVHKIVCELSRVLRLTLFDKAVEDGFEGLALGCVRDFSVMLIVHLSFLFITILCRRRFIRPLPAALPFCPAVRRLCG